MYRVEVSHMECEWNRELFAVINSGWYTIFGWSDGFNWNLGYDRSISFTCDPWRRYTGVSEIPESVDTFKFVEWHTMRMHNILRQVSSETRDSRRSTLCKSLKTLHKGDYTCRKQPSWGKYGDGVDHSGNRNVELAEPLKYLHQGEGGGGRATCAQRRSVIRFDLVIIVDWWILKSRHTYHWCNYVN